MSFSPTWCCSVPGEWRRVCRRDRRTDGRTPDRYITHSARRGQHHDGRIWPRWLFSGLLRGRRTLLRWTSERDGGWSGVPALVSAVPSSAHVQAGRGADVGRGRQRLPQRWRRLPKTVVLYGRARRPLAVLQHLRLRLVRHHLIVSRHQLIGRSDVTVIYGHDMISML